MSAIPLRREAAYTPLDPPTTCMTPGHEGREARNYPGGRLCDPCISRSRQSYVTTTTTEESDRCTTT